jgi:hypothetical protein
MIGPAKLSPEQGAAGGEHLLLADPGEAGGFRMRTAVDDAWGTVHPGRPHHLQRRLRKGGGAGRIPRPEKDRDRAAEGGRQVGDAGIG